MSQIDLQIGSNSIILTDTLGGDVITRARDVKVGITFFKNSNNPTNQPPNLSWGAYLFIKQSSTNVAILYWDNAHYA